MSHTARIEAGGHILSIKFDVSTPRPVDGTCNVCGFDSLIEVTATYLTDEGVHDLSSVQVCARCIDSAPNA